jgi:hypothetical protein
LRIASSTIRVVKSPTACKRHAPATAMATTSSIKMPKPPPNRMPIFKSLIFIRKLPWQTAARNMLRSTRVHLRK